MARKREAAQPAEQAPQAEPTAPADTRQQAPAGNDFAPVAHDNVLPAPPTDATSPPAREPGDDAQQSWVKRASVIVDPEAGVKFHFDYEHHEAVITFNEKPSPELLAAAKPILTGAGFEWDKVSRDGWKKPIRFPQREDDRREAKKAFHEVANAIREHKGLPIRSFGESIPI